MKEMGVQYQKNIKKNAVIRESDVSKEAIARMDIKLILKHIEDYEKSIEEGNKTAKTIQTLVTLYQKGIEYYSAVEDSMFTYLLNKMQDLLKEEDVQAILNGKEPPPKKEVPP